MKKTVSLILALILTCTTLFSLASCGILQRSQCNCDCVKYEGSEGLDPPPQTGDSTQIVLWVVIAGSAMLLIFILLFTRRKNEEEEAETDE